MQNWAKFDRLMSCTVLSLCRYCVQNVFLLFWTVENDLQWSSSILCSAFYCIVCFEKFSSAVVIALGDVLNLSTWSKFCYICTNTWNKIKTTSSPDSKQDLMEMRSKHKVEDAVEFCLYSNQMTARETFTHGKNNFFRLLFCKKGSPS